MHRSKFRLVTVVLVAAAVVMVAVVSVGRAASAVASGPPVIKEPFTVLPCPANPVSTLDLEGCGEHRVVAADKKVDAAASTVYGRLQDSAARGRFAAAQSAWLRFRTADCLSVSDVAEGGSLAGIDALHCDVKRSAERLKELRSFAAELAK